MSAEDFIKQIQEWQEEYEKIHGPYVFKKEVHYNSVGDIIGYQCRPGATYAIWINHSLTLYADLETDEVIGFEIPFIKTIIAQHNAKYRDRRNQLTFDWDNWSDDEV